MAPVTEVMTANLRNFALQSLVPRSVGEDRGPGVRTDAPHLAEEGGDPREPEEGTASDLARGEILLKETDPTDLEEARRVGVTLLLDHPNEDETQGEVLENSPEADLDLTRQGGVATDPTDQKDQLAKKPRAQWGRRFPERKADPSAKITK